MNTHTPELISAALDHPFVETDVWGPGWKGWSRKRKISENLTNRRLKPRDYGIREGDVEDQPQPEAERGVGCGYYDLVWTISDIFRVEDPMLDNSGCGTLFAQ